MADRRLERQATLIASYEELEAVLADLASLQIENGRR